MIELPDEAVLILRAKSFPVLAVAGSDGVPRQSTVWVDLRDGHILINTTTQRVKGRLLQIGVPVSLLAMDPDDPYHYVEVRGRVAHRTTDGADADINALAQKYRGKDFAIREGDTRVTILIEPDYVLVY